MPSRITTSQIPPDSPVTLVHDSDDDLSDDDDTEPTSPFPDMLLIGTNVWECDCSVWYEKCTHFADACKKAHTQDTWPEDYYPSPDCKHLFSQGKKCIPTALLPYVTREHHEQTGHTGRQKLMKELKRFY